ncbi:hypothetical protein A8990_10789 [Paenibacillus taihuensis]|uniref:Uncharacterized protein n=1 Tax=Paenibacillus taihuensis TaxID=1156355 RepID=A0A3D9SFQ3_9BACL|nr:hypothetical protein [Paenibacillus taihuensis]REE88993.1 hypothetical protein A8990_10789 [Paenibacillus taihuensis]
MAVSLDIDTLVSAIMWPVVICIFLLIFRRHMPELLEVLLKRVKKVDFAGVSVELSESKSFTPSISMSQLDLIQFMEREHYTSEVFDIRAQLLADGSADYTVINLGNGNEWLTSRLYIMAIMFAHQKNIKAIVFVESNQGTRKRFVGWAKPAAIRWALSKRYPWFEVAFSEAYCALVRDYGPGPLVTSNRGELGNGEPYVFVLRHFLKQVQLDSIEEIAPEAKSEWISLNDSKRSFEHGEWIDGILLEEIVEDDLHINTIQSNKAKELKIDNSQFQTILDSPGEFIALTSFNGQFKALLERTTILEQVLKQVALPSQE